MRFPREKPFKRFMYRHAVLSPILEVKRFPLKRELPEFCPSPELSNNELVSTDSFLHPFRVLNLSATKDSSLLSISSLHALTFSTLCHNFDSSLTSREASLISGLSVAGHRCVRLVLALFRDQDATHRDPFHSLGITCCVSNRYLFAHLKIAALLINSTATDQQHDKRSLSSVLDGVGVLPTHVLASLLSIPASPELLGLIVDHTVSANGGHVDASLFPLLLGSLLNNDNFFSMVHFDAMNAIVRDRVVSRIGSNGACFDYVSVRWTPLMNKWARVYGKKTRGCELYECYTILLKKAPAVETKLPRSFYVRLIGLIMDCGVDGEAVQFLSPRNCWERLRDVAVQAVRLFGHSPQDLQAVWMVLLKAALTLNPLSDDWQRTLEAYHICAQFRHFVNVDRGAFLQVVRLVSAAVVRQPFESLDTTIGKFIEFFQEQRNASFLWILDGVGALLSDLWQAHGAKARSHAILLQNALQQLLKDRSVAGVTLENNPTIKRTLEKFSIGEPTPFWWLCGCGATSPASSKRCVSCLRNAASKLSWKCVRCGAPHHSPCHAQTCKCGAVNPRQEMATKSGYALCKHCGEMLPQNTTDCPRCRQHNVDTSRQIPCAQCRAPHGANALYCLSCFAVHPDRPFHLWHCAACQEYNYSTWSVCQGCRAARKARPCVTAPFRPWRCGCGALGHPCRLACAICSSHSPRGASTTSATTPLPAASAAYTCAACHKRCDGAQPPPRAVISVGDLLLRVHTCPHCGVLHPRDRAVLSASSLPRHCIICSAVVDPQSISNDGEFHHCGTPQRINENIPFRCRHCKGGETRLTVGFHCSECGWPRPEIEESKPLYYVWQCLKEHSSESECCGAWNYSWCSRCTLCDQGRSGSPWESKVRACSWQCDRCHSFNRAIDALKCRCCAEGTRPVPMCNDGDESGLARRYTTV